MGLTLILSPVDPYSDLVPVPSGQETRKEARSSSKSRRAGTRLLYSVVSGQSVVVGLTTFQEGAYEPLRGQ